MTDFAAGAWATGAWGIARALAFALTLFVGAVAGAIALPYVLFTLGDES